MNWLPRLNEARAAVAASGGDKRRAAAALSQAWGCRVSRDALDKALLRWADEGARNDAPAPMPEAHPAPVGSVAPMAPERDGLVAILADLHIPQQESAAVACAEAWIVANQPTTIVLAGDIGEWESCSQHGTSPEAPTYRADLEAVRAWLKRLRSIALNARIVALEGNHETRLTRMLCSVAPSLYGVHSVAIDLGLDALDIEWIPEDRQPLRISTLDIIHGHQMVRGSGPIYVAAKGVNTYGSPGRTVCIAHTHKRQMFRRPMADGHAEAIALPCLRTLSAGWLHGEVAGWSHGFGVATVRAGYRTALEVVDIERGSCCWGGRVYSG